MEKLFDIDIRTPDRKVYAGKVSSLIAPSELGYLGVLANHAPLIANLAPGKISLKETSGRQIIIRSKGEGFLEVLKNNVNILLDNVEEPPSAAHI